MWGCCSCFSKTYEAPEVLELDYRHSSLTEVPPDVFTFERTLEKLDLGSNQISDLPPSLFHCHELKELDLCDNDLMSIPPAIGTLTRLWKLDLSRNAISDVADSIKNCKNLVYLDLSLNHLSKLPEGISQLVNLEELFLNDTYLEFLHANFGRLTKLKVVELRENSLQSLPKSMNRLHSLQRLDIGQNDVLELPEVVGTMTNLTELWCDNNSMRSLPKFIGNLTKLNCVDVSQNDIQEIADEISKCTQLSDFSLNANSLESLPDSFPKLDCLSVLRLDSNSIQYLPEDFGNLKSLQELSLVRNIVKALPASIGLLRKLHTLYLDDNLLAELPKEIGSCISLSVLSVCKNRLTEIPSEVGHLSNLKVLSLSGNLIVHLPVSILNIPKLGALWLSESQSKPLLPLNKEIDPSTGQHVLTCYLLPQLPPTAEENRLVAEEKDEATPPRRSRPSIKFVTDMDPPVVENNVNKRGLLRAPTPYPKELRALAKHASHLRQHKDQNGEVVNTDEPEYEGDYTEEELVHMDGREAKHVPDPVRKLSAPEANTNQLNGGFNHNLGEPVLGSSYPPTNSVSQSPVPDMKGKVLHGPNERERIGLPLPNLSQIGRVSQASYASSYSSTSSSSAIGVAPPVPPHATLPVESILNKIDETNKRGSDLAYNLPSNNEGVRFPGILDSEDKCSNYGNTGSEMARKSPPPYHVAARRAAFFRSSGSNSSNIATSPPDTQSRMSPLVSNKPYILPPSNDAEVGLPPVQQLPSNNNVNIPHLQSGALSPLQSHSYNQQKHSMDIRQVNNELGHGEKASAQSSPNSIEDAVDSPEQILNRTYIIENRDEIESEVISSVETVIGGQSDVTEMVQEVIKSSVQSELLCEKRGTEREEFYKETVVKDTFSNNLGNMSRLEETTSTMTTKLQTMGEDHNESRSQLEKEVRNSGKNPETFSPSLLNFPPANSNGHSSHAQSGPTSSIPTAGATSRNFTSGIPVSPASMSYASSATRIASFNKNKPATSATVGSTSAITTASGPTSPNSGPPNTLNPSESFSKIPKFGAPTKFMNSSDASSAVPSPQHPTRITGIPMFASSTHPNNQPVKDYGHTVPSSLPSPISKQNSVEPLIMAPTTSSSRIPSFTSIPTSGIPPPNNANLQQVPKKPDTAPKPRLQLPRAITPTRIPSVLGDTKIKESAIPSRVDNNKMSTPEGNVNKNINASVAYNANHLISNANSTTISHQNTTANNNNSGIPGPGTRIPRFGDTTEKQELRRSSSGAGSKIPKFNDSSSALPSQPYSQNTVSEVLESLPDTSSSLNIPGGGSKIPTMSIANRKPWIFGTHKNARVVPVEYRKVNALGFTVIDGATGTATEGNGIYVDSIEAKDSTVKIGDKILQVDGIDVSNMGIEIVRKILSNCQENIHLLVSRQN